MADPRNDPDATGHAFPIHDFTHYDIHIMDGDEVTALLDIVRGTDCACPATDDPHLPGCERGARISDRWGKITKDLDRD